MKIKVPVIENVREDLNTFKELNGYFEMTFEEFAGWLLDGGGTRSSIDISNSNVAFRVEDMYHKLFKNGIFKGGI